MIGKLTGTLLERIPEVLLDCHGVGYEVNVPMSTFYNLPAVGERVSLLTQFIVRGDAQLLYGFATAPERQAFRELIKISGVGRARRCPFCRAWASLTWPRPSPCKEAGRLVKVPESAKDRRAPAAGTQRQARCRHRRQPPTPPAMRRRTSSRRCWRWATTTKKLPRPSLALPADVGE